MIKPMQLQRASGAANSLQARKASESNPDAAVQGAQKALAGNLNQPPPAQGIGQRLNCCG